MEEGAIDYGDRAGLVGTAYLPERNADGEVSGFERGDAGRDSFRTMLIPPEIPSRQAIAEIVALCRSQAEILLTEELRVVRDGKTSGGTINNIYLACVLDTWGRGYPPWNVVLERGADSQVGVSITIKVS